MSLLEVQHINTGYGKKQVLYDVSLTIEEGQTVLLVGSNGSGKSTLFKAIYGLLPIWNGQEDGKVLFNGEDITNVKSHRLIDRGIMYIPQKHELFEDMTVEQNLRMALLHLNDNKESKKRMAEVFSQIGLLEYTKTQRAAKLSGGERRLLSLGMVLLNRPKMVLYDEPLSGLSGNNINTILRLLRFLSTNGTTLLLVEHRIKTLSDISDTVIGLRLGRRLSNIANNLENIKSQLL